MPDRDYYLKDDEDLAATRDAYKKYLATMLTLAGRQGCRSRAQAVLRRSRRKIAKVAWAAADRRDADKIYNPMTHRGAEATRPTSRGTPSSRRQGSPPTGRTASAW